MAEPPIEDVAQEQEAVRSDRRTYAREVAIAVRNTLKLGGSLLATWALALVVRLQVPAHLGPVRQGYYGFAEAFATMFFTAIGFGVDTYVMKEVPVRPKHASDFVGGIFALRSALSLFLLAAMAITLRVTHRPLEIQLAVAVFGLSQLAISVNNTLARVLQAATNVGRLAVANVAAKVVWGGGLLLGLHYQAPLYMLAMSVLASELLRAVVLIPAARRAAELRYEVHPALVRRVIVTSIPFFVHNVAIGLGNNLSMSALEFMRHDEREVGWFAAIQNLATLAFVLSPLLVSVVMPLLSRAHARSESEMMAIVRRAVEGLVVIIAPVTVFISVSSDVLLKIAFGEKYAPAAAGLSILSLVFAVTYVNMLLAGALVIMGRSWSVTTVSLTAVLAMMGFMIVFVPIGRVLFHVGGECAGAALAFITNEACVVVALVARFKTSPFDARNVRAIAKTLAVAATVVVADRLLRPIGVARLSADVAIYAALAVALGLVRTADVRRVIALVRSRGEPVDRASGHT
jgi:O-antigen/teichoic acid export membrane protein